ncbi:hypothetical protein OWV82_024941 [Melia azedarach]|uniref:Uncharacterized protein n=1 Tax=Melia azedarach TaxID=155640 RepID=A0ACC1WRR5_MELAZ|nr:hypothetical protein OWV82_024941 [Melia azedarach]
MAKPSMRSHSPDASVSISSDRRGRVCWGQRRNGEGNGEELTVVRDDIATGEIFKAVVAGGVVEGEDEVDAIMCLSQYESSENGLAVSGSRWKKEWVGGSASASASVVLDSADIDRPTTQQRNKCIYVYYYLVGSVSSSPWNWSIRVKEN